MKYIRHTFLQKGLLLLSGMVMILFVTQYLKQPIAETPIWNGITPSVSTRAEVEAILGKPDKRWQGVLPNDGMDPLRQMIEYIPKFWVWNYGYYHEQLPEGPYGFHEIQFNMNGTVDYIVEIKWLDRDEDIVTVDEIVALYGKPERVTWSRRDSFNNALLYCQQGLIIHATMDRVKEIIYFKPMTTEQCIHKFFNEVATTNIYNDGDIIVELDPWGFNGESP